MLANPGFAIAHLVQGDDLAQVRLQGLGEVGPGRVQGHGEQAGLHALVS